MAKGYNAYQERQNTLSSFGKVLSRRSRSQCELCQANGVKLQIFEVAPVPAEPEVETCILICEECQIQIEKPKKIVASHWRCLQESVWSEVAPVQVISLRMLKKLAPNENWAANILEDVYVEEDIQEWADNE